MQRAAQPSAGDPHLVDGIGLVTPNLRVARHQLGNLLGKMGLHDLPRCRELRGRARPPGRVGGIGWAGRQHPANFRARVGPDSTCGQQSLFDVVQQRTWPDAELGLPLPPVQRRLARRIKHQALDLIVHDFDQDRPSRVEELMGGASRRQAGDRQQGGGARHRPDQGEQAVGHGGGRVGALSVDLFAVRADRDLQMPAGVGAAGAVAQGDARRPQAQVRGVEVGRDELVDDRRADPVDPVDLAQVRQRHTRLHVVLSFYLTGHVNHHSSVPGTAPSCCSKKIFRASPPA